MAMIPTVVIYHANCHDGFTAAWIANRWCSKNGHPLPVLIPANYGDDPPYLGADERVLIVDFSYSRKQMTDLHGKVKGLIVLDHHKTAEENLKELPFATFDMNKSGASMAWDYFFPDGPSNALVKYVEDRDLWKFELPHSREVNQWLRSIPYTITDWEEASRRFSIEPRTVIAEGQVLLRFQDQQVRIMADRAVWVKLDGHRVPCVNATCFFSEVGEELCKRHEVPFSLYYFDREDGSRQWGMRARTGFDCSRMAKKLGGGGHPGSAGFSSMQGWMPTRILEENADD